MRSLILHFIVYVHCVDKPTTEISTSKPATSPTTTPTTSTTTSTVLITTTYDYGNKDGTEDLETTTMIIPETTTTYPPGQEWRNDAEPDEQRLVDSAKGKKD